MILSSKALAMEWRPPWRETERDCPVYLFRAGDVAERGLMEAELSGTHHAGPVYDFDLREAFERGLETLLAEDAEALARLKAASAAEAALEEGEVLPDDEGALLAQAREVIGQHWPPYKALRERMARRVQMVPIVAFRRYCTGWKGKGLPPFVKGIDGLAAIECLAGVPELELAVGGRVAYGLQRGGGQEKNFAARSRSGSTRRTSASRANPKKAGGSAGTSG